MVHLTFYPEPPRKSHVSAVKIFSLLKTQCCDFADNVSLQGSTEKIRMLFKKTNKPYEVLETSSDFTKHIGIIEGMQKNSRLMMYKGNQH